MDESDGKHITTAPTMNTESSIKVTTLTVNNKIKTPMHIEINFIKKDSPKIPRPYPRLSIVLKATLLKMIHTKHLLYLSTTFKTTKEEQKLAITAKNQKKTM